MYKWLKKPVFPGGVDRSIRRARSTSSRSGWTASRCAFVCVIGFISGTFLGTVLELFKRGCNENTVATDLCEHLISGRRGSGRMRCAARPRAASAAATGAVAVTAATRRPSGACFYSRPAEKTRHLVLWVFVPSLSWQNDHFYIKIAPKKAFFRTAVRNQPSELTMP
eukprot:COSAG06_NODE_19726_length_825_cov_0.889807_2_plen_167_part_00